MNNTIRNKIRYSDVYTKIYYQTRYSHGEMILKDELLNSKPSFHKLFKDSKYEVIRNYRVTMKDIICSVIRSLKYQFYIYEYKLKKEQTRTYMDDDLVDEYTTKLTKIHSILVRLERKLAI